MRCPNCGCDDSKVIDSRPSESHEAIRRRRVCTACGCRFTTYERREELPLVVIKSDGRREPFDRQKIMRGLVAATVKRDLTWLSWTLLSTRWKTSFATAASQKFPASVWARWSFYIYAI